MRQPFLQPADAVRRRPQKRDKDKRHNKYEKQFGRLSSQEIGGVSLPRLKYAGQIPMAEKCQVQRVNYAHLGQIIATEAKSVPKRGRI